VLIPSPRERRLTAPLHGWGCHTRGHPRRGSPRWSWPPGSGSRRIGDPQAVAARPSNAQLGFRQAHGDRREEAAPRVSHAGGHRRWPIAPLRGRGTGTVGAQGRSQTGCKARESDEKRGGDREVEPARAPGAVDLGRAHMVEKGGGKARQNPGAAQAMATRTARGRRRLREEGGDGCEKREVDAANRMRAIGANRAGYGRQKRDENAYYRRNQRGSARI
jgi:hypothetical protein